ATVGVRSGQILPNRPGHYKLAAVKRRRNSNRGGGSPMTFVPRAVLCGAGALLGCLDGSRPAAAQETQLEEVVVSAQKRVENVQNVPIAVTVVSGDALSKANVSG